MMTSSDLMDAWNESTVDELLAAGGDSRQRIDPTTGLSKYGCSMIPRPEVAAFGSCTASSVSPGGFDAAAQLLDRLRTLRGTSRIDEPLGEYFRDIRDELRFHLTGFSTPDLEIALSPSGTDVELLALLVAHGDGSRPVTNIIVGPTEVGSGTVLAAGGRYFDALTPSGHEVTVGDPVDETLAARTEVVSIELRDAEGRPRDVTELDDEITRLTTDRIAQGRRVLLHVTAHSKTGLHAPSLLCIDTMRQTFGDDVLVMVDAAQGRFSRRGLRSVLASGHLVSVTSSKFYGGPPFAGALLVPAQLAARARAYPGPTENFDRFFSSSYLPESWVGLRSRLPAHGSIGVLLRWVAGMSEIRRYYHTHSRLRFEVLSEFERAVPEAFADSTSASLEDTVAPQLPDEAERVLQSKMTVFSFDLQDSDGRRMEMEQLRAVWRWLNNDISALAPDAGADEQAVLARRFHIGQPVLLSSAASKPAVLRVALGGVLLSQVAQDVSWGEEYLERVERLHDELTGLVRKIDAVSRHFAALESSALSPVP